MPLEIVFENGDAGVLVILTGDVSAADVTAANTALYADPRAASIRYQIWDLLGSRCEGFSEHELRSFAIQDYHAARANPDQRIAIVLPQPDRARLLEVFERAWSKLPTLAFASVAEAREWIASQEGVR